MASAEQEAFKATAYIEHLLLQREKFTGSLVFNFKDGILKDCLESKRTKFEEGK